MPASSASKPRHTNLLAGESSPYLLQHQHNPVNWRPWGHDAFAEARAKDRPIFLSIGYSTCYWCHVMERESFENEDVAAEMNSRFICIKVDREERPDVDQLYMNAVQVLTQHGGWPMSVWLTPDLKPFFGGTYFPRQDMNGRMGFLSLIHAIDEAWKKRRSEVNASVDQITDILRKLARPPQPQSELVINSQLIDELIDRSVSDFDDEHGGFGSAPKFPRQTLLELLLAYIDGGADAKRAKRLSSELYASLDAMADGGIHDHLGGGFHRYSTDAQWLIPHFEIMLYDNAQLAWIYAEAFRQSGNDRYAEVARGVLDFILRDMTSAEGAFYTAFDAEAQGREGRPYLWTRREVEEVLTSSLAATQASIQGDAQSPVELFLEAYGLNLPPNFSDPHHGPAQPDQYVLHLPRPLAQVAHERGLSPKELDRLLTPLRQALLNARKKRVQPMLDTKILTSWNALMIRALSHAGHVLDEPRYRQAAITAANWLLKHHVQKDGLLLHATRPDHPGRAIPGFLDDYAALLDALVDMRQDAGDDIPDLPVYIRNLEVALHERFAATGGGFFFTDRYADDLIVRQMIGDDSPLPSGNALAARALFKLGERDQARQTIAPFAESLRRGGEGMSALLQCILQMRDRQLFPQTSDHHLFPSERFVTKPVVALSAHWIAPSLLQVGLKIDKDFHLNAHDAPADLISTKLKIEPPYARNVRFIEYPPGQYVDAATIIVHFQTVPDQGGDPLRIALSYQPCTDSACLAPAVARLSVAWPGQ
ncbi:MAG: thioredoxin domain-containing protein [Phycisphaerales bacterium]|nr:thioredoxin domain-containing protein [Phycisphaerales bacterium]